MSRRRLINASPPAWVHRLGWLHVFSGNSSRSVSWVFLCPCFKQNFKSNQPLGSLVQCQARPRSMTFRAICFFPKLVTRLPRFQAKTRSALGTGSVPPLLWRGFLVLWLLRLLTHEPFSSMVFGASPHPGASQYCWRVAAPREGTRPTDSTPFRSRPRAHTRPGSSATNNFGMRSPHPFAKPHRFEGECGPLSPLAERL